MIAEADASGATRSEYLYLEQSLVAVATRENPPVEDLVIDNGDPETSETGTWHLGSPEPQSYAFDWKWTNSFATYR